MENDFLSNLNFNETKINGLINKINLNLKKYIEDNIIEEYKLNDGGHNIEHVNYVLKRAFELVESNLNIDILYTSIMFHDIACHIDRTNHEKLSAKRAFEDEFLNNYFSKEDMLVIKEAIEDHRASLEYEPRNIYGKILSSADRKVEIKIYLLSSMSFDIKNNPYMPKDEVIKESYKFAIKKFGDKGYAVNKSYIFDNKYEKFLNDLQYLIMNEKEYFKLAGIVYDKIKKESV